MDSVREAVALQQAYKNSYFRKAAPRDDLLLLAVELVCCKVQFCWAPEFFELVDEQLSEVERFKSRAQKLLQLERKAHGQGKTREQALRCWSALPYRKHVVVEMHRNFLKAPDYAVAYFQHKIAKHRWPF